jgi:tetratricopeptide (TPR) repeat protein
MFISVACSTKKDKYLNRKFQALNTQYNVLYNGEVSLQEGIEGLKASHIDNFWETLPIERMVKRVEKADSDPKKEESEGVRNAQFDRAEEKAVKGIQKRSMYIGGRERNSHIDEAHLLLGKARYYELRFVPAVEAFNYVLYKYPDSDRINEAKIWREKANIRLENNELAIQNLQKVLQDIKSKDQIYADAHAALAQAYLNTNDNANALVSLKKALNFTDFKEEKARYRFILGQIYENINQPDSAFQYFQQVIDMKRKSPRVYVINAHSRQAAQFDYKTGDTIQFLEKFNDLIEDRENRDYLDVLYNRLALYYEGQEKDDRAIFYYNKSLRSASQDMYMKTTNYRNIAEIHFNNAVYKKAGQYYDSTLTLLKPRTREHRLIRKKRENLEDVIKYEAIAYNNDSILKVVAMTKPTQILYYQDYIDKLKKLEEERQARESLNSNVDSDSNQDENSRINDNSKSQTSFSCLGQIFSFLKNGLFLRVSHFSKGSRLGQNGLTLEKWLILKSKSFSQL